MFRQPIDCILSSGRNHLFIFEIESEIVDRAAAGASRKHLFIFEIENEVVGRAAAGRLSTGRGGAPVPGESGDPVARSGRAPVLHSSALSTASLLR
jgi:hypothetical protein